MLVHVTFSIKDWYLGVGAKRSQKFLHPGEFHRTGGFPGREVAVQSFSLLRDVHKNVKPLQFARISSVQQNSRET